MGRLKKYHTEEERKAANRKKSQAFYWRNKKSVDARMREYYWRKRIAEPEIDHAEPIEVTITLTTT